MQTAAEMCDLTLPWHHGCCCSQLCTGIALMCEGEQEVIWLETMGGFLDFQTEQPPDLICTRIHECEWEGGLGKAPGGAEGWVANIFFSSKYYLNLSQNNHSITITLSLLWYLLCGGWSTSTGVSFLAGHLPGTDGKNQKSSLPSSRVLICGMQSSCGMPQPRAVSAAIIFSEYSVWASQRQHF